jgi:glucose/arabinose dehydrogenase
MSRFHIVFINGLLISFCSLQAQTPVINLQSFSIGYTNPLDIENCGDSRLFIVQKNGYIYICDSLGNKNPTPFLDVHTEISTGPGGERGLLGLAFHPNYAVNGYFFIYYTIVTTGDLRISRFSVDALNQDVADPNSEQVLMEIPHPTNTNHNGGCLKFGPDGYLYIGTGDGGSAGDPPNNSQNTKSYLGKLLRLDVDNVEPYTIPPDNPFIGDTVNYYPEIWAYGLRNPWRFSFDRLTHDLWIGDVGQDLWEEIDFQPASDAGGENYGWRCYEGNHQYNFSLCSADSIFTFPIFEYAHPTDINECASVTGGYVYRGNQYPNMFGKYFFVDYCSGEFRYTEPDGAGGWTTVYLVNDDDYDFASFGEDRNGEMYVAAITSGNIYKLTDISTGIDQQVSQRGISISPNPSNGIITIKTGKPNNAITNLSIWNLSGQIVKSFEIPSSLTEFTIDATDLAMEFTL